MILTYNYSCLIKCKMRTLTEKKVSIHSQNAILDIQVQNENSKVTEEVRERVAINSKNTILEMVKSVVILVI